MSESAGVAPGQRLRIKRDKALVLFGGTRVLQHTGDRTARIKTPDDGCLAVVLRTGFETAQGAPEAVRSARARCGSKGESAVVTQQLQGCQA